MVKLAFHDTDADILARISVSWNAALTPTVDANSQTSSDFTDD